MNKKQNFNFSCAIENLNKKFISICGIIPSINSVCHQLTSSGSFINPLEEGCGPKVKEK